MDDPHTQQREILIAHLQRQGITHPAVLNAIRAVPRHLFVPAAQKPYAYLDSALPIGCQQTISQPYVVARMTQTLVETGALHRVLEIGTGSGYQAAILAQLAEQVFTIERIRALLIQAQQRFQKLRLTNIHTRHADGQNGWPEHAPYNAIIVTAAADQVPSSLLTQLANHGRLIIPVKENYQGQVLQLITRQNSHYYRQNLDWVAFVPLLPGAQ